MIPVTYHTLRMYFTYGKLFQRSILAHRALWALRVRGLRAIECVTGQKLVQCLPKAKAKN